MRIEYSCRSLPLTTDQRVLNFCYLSQRIRTCAVGLTVKIVEQGRTRPLSKADWVAFIILQRLSECLLSFEFLVALGRERDAAVLLVTVFELSFDLRFVHIHPEAAETWMAHSEWRRKPWRVSALLKELYTDPSDRSAMESLYEHCSMIKHANPSGGVLTLPFGVASGRIIMKARSTTDMLLAYTFAAAGCVHETVLAAVKIWTASGFDLGPGCSEANQAWDELSALEEKHILEILQEIAQSPSEPEGA